MKIIKKHIYAAHTSRMIIAKPLTAVARSIGIDFHFRMRRAQKV